MKRSGIIFLLLITFIAIGISSCQKDDQLSGYPPAASRPSATSPQVSVNDTDTVQNIFTVNVLNNPTAGRILIAPFINGFNTAGTIMILNERGRVIKQIKIAGLVGNFERWNVKGKLRYTYSVYDLSNFTIAGVGYFPGYEVVTDSNFNPIDKVQLYSYGSISNTQQKSIDGHDFIFIDDHHYITETYYQKTVNNIPYAIDSFGAMKVVACVIQEINNGIITWQWDATNYPELYSTSVEGNKFNDTSKVFDYAHLNSIFIDPKDNNLICSFRNLNQVMKIERGTGKIIWRLGGTNSDFDLGSDQVFLRQHHATLTDNNQTLMLFDDGEINTRPYSRILEFNLNEAGRFISGFRSYNIPEPFTQYMGSVQKNDNTYFIGGGTGNYVLEVNYITGEKLLELKSTDNFYRAYKY